MGFKDTSKYQDKNQNKPSFMDTTKYQFMDTSKYQNEEKPKVVKVDTSRPSMASGGRPMPVLDQKKLDKASGTAGAFTANLVDSATLGIATKGLNKFENGLGDKVLADASKGHGIASTVGNLTGYTVPFGAASKVAKPLTKGITNKLLKTATTGALEGALVGGAEGGIKGKSVVKSAGEIAALGVGGNLAIAGLGKLASKVLKPRVFETKVTPNSETPTLKRPTTQQTKPIVSKLSPNLKRSSKPVEQPNIITQATTPIDANVNGTNSTELGNKQATSKFYSNSLMEGNALTKEGKQALDETQYIYDVKHNEDSLKRAQTLLDTNGLENEVNRLKTNGLNSAEDSMSHYLATKELMNEAKTTGDYSKLNDFLETTRPSITNAGQTIQALSQFKKSTPEGAIMTAHKVVENVQNAIKKENPNVFKDVNKVVKDVGSSVDAVDKEFADKVVNELTNEQKLANRVSSTLSEPNTPKNDIEKNMVNTLFSIAKQDLPEQTKNIKDPIQFVGEAIKNRNQYNDVWNKAKDLLRQKYANSPDKLALLDDYFNKSLKPVYSQNKLNQAIQQQLKSNGINLAELVKQHYSVGSEVRTSLKETLVSKAGLSGQDAEYLATQINNRMKELTKAKKEQILSQMFKNRPKPQQKAMIDKIIELHNLGGFKNDNYKNLVYEKYGIPTLSNEEVKTIADRMTNAQTLEGRAKDIEIAKVMQLIGDKVPVNLAEKVKALQRISLLLNTKTMGRNVIGNTILGTLENVKDVIGTPLDILVSKATGKRSTMLPNLLTQSKGLKKGFTETLQDAKLGIDTSPTRGQYDIPQGKIFKNKLLNGLDKATKTGLQLGDRPFYEGAYNDRLNQLMRINKVSEPTEDMIKEATEFAKDRTFQNDSNIAKGMKQLQEGLNKLTGNKDIGIGTFAVPFTKTPANILDKAISYSPIGYGKALNELRNIKPGTFNQKNFIDNIARGTTGTGLIMMGYDLASKGHLMGAANKDSDVAALQKQTGASPYSIKVGDNYYTIDWAQPSAVPLMIGADIFHGGKDRKSAQNVVLDAIKSGGETLFKQSLLQGMQKLFGGYTPIQGVTDVIKSIPGQFVPSALKQAAQALDKTQRNTYSSDTSGFVGNSIKSKLPIVSKGLQPKIDTLGREVENYQGKNTPFNILLNPGFKTTEKSTPAEKLVLGIYDKSGLKNQFPRVAPKNIKGTPLTEEQYTNLQKEMGKETLDMLNNLAKNVNIDSMTDKQLENLSQAIESRLTKIESRAKKKVLPKELLFQKR